MQLILLRHGIPVEPENWEGSEPSRPLTAEGRIQTRAALQTLKSAQKIETDEIWCSPFTRCLETARIAAEILGVPHHPIPALASGSDITRTLPRLQGDPGRWPEKLMLVGHMPDLGLLISALTGQAAGKYSLGRGGIARLQGEFAPGRMTLDWLLSAEQAIQGA